MSERRGRSMQIRGVEWRTTVDWPNYRSVMRKLSAQEDRLSQRPTSLFFTHWGSLSCEKKDAEKERKRTTAVENQQERSRQGTSKTRDGIREESERGECT